MRISFSNITLYNRINFNRSKISDANNFSSPLLKPLQSDTVSFSGRAKLIGGDMKFAPAENICRSVNENAEPARYLLQTVLDKYITPLKSMDINDDPHEKPVFEFTTRKKTSSSIREKVVSKFSKITREETSKFSKQITDELSKHFKCNKSKEYACDAIRNLTKFLFHDEIKVPPYSNIDIFFDEIVAQMQLQDIFDFQSVPDEKRIQSFNQIKNALSESADYTNHLSGRYIDPTTVKGVKHYANDIVGGRIILRASKPEHTQVVLDALTQAVNDGMLKVTSIENNLPAKQNLPKGMSVDDYAYATEKQLKAFKKSSGAQVIVNESKSGYLALHINLEFTDELLSMYNGVFEGFSGELQIIGQDVLALKEVEDLCYKLKDNKNSIHVDYKPFKDHFLKYYVGEDVKKAFDDYTYTLYLSQRSLAPGSPNRKFPSLKDLGFDGKVPDELDFNVLRTIKEYCDIKHNETLKSQEKLVQESKNKKTALMMKKRELDILTVKNLIRYNYS